MRAPRSARSVTRHRLASCATSDPKCSPIYTYRFFFHPQILRKTPFLKVLPTLIAENSRCSCGETLRLGNHSLNVHRNVVVLTGLFFCDLCGGEGRAALAKIRDAIGRLWNQITKIKIGPTGVELQKKPADSNRTEGSNKPLQRRRRPSG